MATRQTCVIPLAVLAGLGLCQTAAALDGLLLGKVVDAQGKPVAGARVAGLGSGGTGPVLSAVTSATGEFEWPDLPLGQLTLSVVAPEGNLADDRWNGYPPQVLGQRIRVSAGHATRVLRQLQPGGQLVVEVPETLEAIPFCSCDITTWKGSLRLATSVLPKIEADGTVAQVTYSGLAPATDYAVALECEGLRRRTREGLGVTAGAAVRARFDDTLDLTTGVDGLLLDSSGEGIGGRLVYVRQAAGDAVSGLARTQEGGRFRIVDLPAGRYVLVAEGGLDPAEAEVVSGSVASVVIRLRAWATGSGMARSGSEARFGGAGGTVAAARASQPPGGWPWLKPPNIAKCGTAVPPGSPYHDEKLAVVRRAFEQGVPCLARKMPKTAAEMKELVDPDVPSWLPTFLKKLWTPQLTVEFDCPPERGECALVRAFMPVFGLITLTTNAGQGDCGCLENSVFHEYMHKIYGAPLECPVWACDKECFNCAPPVPEDPENSLKPDERCECGKPCSQYPDLPAR